MPASAEEKKLANKHAAKRFRAKTKSEKHQFKNRIAALEKHVRDLEAKMASGQAPCNSTKRPIHSFAIEMHSHAVALLNIPVVEETSRVLPPFDLSAQVDYMQSTGVLFTNWRWQAPPPLLLEE